jgi:hypothetical protein
LLIAGLVIEYALIEIVLQQHAHLRRIGTRQQICSDVFRPDRIGFLLFKVLALIIPANGHRKSEADD